MSAPSAINNQREIFVGGTPSSGAISAATTLKSAVFNVGTNAGEIKIFSKEGTQLTVATAATTDEFVVAVSRGADLPPLVSDVIVKSSINGISRKVYAAATEESVAYGYNGTSGSILDTAVYAGDVYTVKMILQQFLSGSDDERIKRGDYKSLTTDGQAEVALGVVKSLNLNMVREVKNSAGNPPVIAKALCNVALAAAFDFDETITVTKGVNQILLATDIDYNTGTDVVVGDYIRLGATATTAVTLSSPVYKVIAINGLVLTLDQPVQSASGSYVTGSSYSQVITNAAGQAADWGIVLTGQPVAFSISKKRYAKVRLAVQANSAFGSTVKSVISSANEGTGTYEQVAELENFLQGFKGEQYEMGEPYLFDSSALRLASSAVAGGGYDMITFGHSSNIVNFSTDVAKKEVVIAVPVTTPPYGTGTTGSNENFTDVLEVLAGTASGALAI